MTKYQSLQMKIASHDLVLGIKNGKISVLKNRDGKIGKVSFKDMIKLVLEIF